MSRGISRAADPGAAARDFVAQIRAVQKVHLTCFDSHNNVTPICHFVALYSISIVNTFNFCQKIAAAAMQVHKTNFIEAAVRCGALKFGNA